MFPEDWRQNIDSISEKFKEFALENSSFFQEHLSLLHAHKHEHNAIELLAQTIKGSSQKKTFLALAPLTNLAELFLGHPDLIQKVGKIYIMGGAFQVPGNLSIIKDSIAEVFIVEKLFSESGFPVEIAVQVDSSKLLQVYCDTIK